MKHYICTIAAALYRQLLRLAAPLIWLRDRRRYAASVLSASLLLYGLWLLRGIALDLAYLRAHPVEVTLNQPVRYLREGQLPPAHASESSWTYSAVVEEALASRKGKRGGR